MKRKLLSLLSVLLLLLPGFAACSDDHHDDASFYLQEKLPQGHRTVLIYMAAQNSLGTGGNAGLDSMEIMQAHTEIPPQDRLILFIDDARKPRMYRILAESRTPLLVHQWEKEETSTDPHFFQQVLQEVKERYPADEYGLVLWSHADGWLPAMNGDAQSDRTLSGPVPSFRPMSFGIDNGLTGGSSDKGTEMEVEDLAEEVRQSGLKPRYIFFDACLMQSIEVAWTFRDVTECLIGSPIQRPADGTQYTWQIRKGLFSEHPETDIVDSDVQSAGSYGIVVSSINPARLDSLAHVLRRELPLSACANRNSAEINQATPYQAYVMNFLYRPHQYDAAGVLEEILPPLSAQKAQKALDYALIHKGCTPSFWIGPGGWNFMSPDINHFSGTAMFVPQDIYSYYADACPHGDHNTNFTRTAWYEAAGWFATGW